MMQIWQVDAFTAEPFKGNPAAVCWLDGPGDAGWMQSIAMEMNLSETAFVWPLAAGRWWLWPALVHAHERGTALRSCDAGNRACPLARAWR